MRREEICHEKFKKKLVFPNLRTSILLPEHRRTTEVFCRVLIAAVGALIIATRIPSLWAYARESSTIIHLVSAYTALGVVSRLSIGIPELVSVVFVYFCVLVFWREMLKIFSETGIFKGMKAVEWVVYGVLLVITLSFMIASFTQTDAFYGTEYPYDIIYTSDSPKLVKGNAYLTLMHEENDLRQPLFAVFSAPFTGIPYLFAKLIGASLSVWAMLLNSVQIVLLFFANFMLTKMMKLDSMKRMCFMTLISCTYTQLLFTLMIEQYIIAYFWLVFCLYLISEKGRPNRIALWGAGGTLLTSMVLLPFMTEKSPVKNFKEWFKDMVKYGLEFVALMLVFGRFDVIFNAPTKVYGFRIFTGYGLTLKEKIFQYVGFVRNCFIAPNAGVNTTTAEYISWQLDAVSSISIVGVVILLLAVFSSIWNRDKRSSRMAAGWAFFSVVMLLILGWGTKENGLILYSLYFGWAFLVLLFQMIEKVENKLNVKYIVPVVSVCCAIALVAINIPAIVEMVNFAIAYYPI